jgi:3-dehydroquinate synthetase
MTNKIVVEFFNDNDQMTSIEQFKSLNALHKQYPKYEYHALRRVWLKTMNKETASKKLQKNANIKMKIFDYDTYSNPDRELLNLGPLMIREIQTF